MRGFLSWAQLSHFHSHCFSTSSFICYPFIKCLRYSHLCSSNKTHHHIVYLRLKAILPRAFIQLLLWIKYMISVLVAFSLLKHMLFKISIPEWRFFPFERFWIIHSYRGLEVFGFNTCLQTISLFSWPKLGSRGGNITKTCPILSNISQCTKQCIHEIILDNVVDAMIETYKSRTLRVHRGVVSKAWWRANAWHES